MNTNKIDTIVKKVVGRRYEIDSHLSKTTNSYYVNVINGDCRVQLRFSDHLNKFNKVDKSKAKTFIVSNNINEKLLESYVKNRVRTLGTVSLFSAFDKINSAKIGWHLYDIGVII